MIDPFAGVADDLVLVLFLLYAIGMAVIFLCGLYCGYCLGKPNA